MKRLFFIFLLILCSGHIFTQDEQKMLEYIRNRYDKTTINQVKTLDSLITHSVLKDSVHAYYENVYKAEQFIMKDKFKQASKLYKEAFSYNPPFTMDLKNAINCELRIDGDKKDLLKYCWQYIGKTIDMDKYNVQDYAFLLNTSIWSDIEKIIDTVKSAYNLDIAYFMNKLLWNDKAYRNEIFIKNHDNYEEIITSKEWLDSICKIEPIII